MDIVIDMMFDSMNFDSLCVWFVFSVIVVVIELGLIVSGIVNGKNVCVMIVFVLIGLIGVLLLFGLLGLFSIC